MYEAYYGLRTKPFSILPDPHFIYWAQPHSMAFSMLEYGVHEPRRIYRHHWRSRFGQDHPCSAPAREVARRHHVGLVTNAQGDRGDLLHWLMASLGQDFRDNSYVGLYQKFEAFLVDQHRHGRRTVVIVDEAQNLGAKSLEELRMMSNLNTAQQELLQIILVGQPQLKTLLSKPELVQFAQRVGSDFHLVPLPHEDVTPYIDHRLAVAGAERTLFTEEACELVATVTGGTPRLINVLCDTSLMYGFGSGAEFISSQIVQSVIDDKRVHGVFAPAPAYSSRVG